MRFFSPKTGPDMPRNPQRRPGGILRYLLRDSRAATLPMMGMAIIPLAGLVGGAVDMSRLYITKTRLQQACDSGALAGRKVMGGGAWSANSNAANAAALQFFDLNFKDGAFGTTGRTRAFSEAAGRVAGAASATVPMTIMKIFKKTPTTINVTCSAEMRLPNTDIMFVLDTTGSMGETIPGDSEQKIVALRRATKCFFEIVARLATTADCGPDPSGGLSSQVQVRFGFVPYSTNVNVGALLPAAHFADAWTYQTRVANFATPVAGEIISDTYEAYTRSGEIRSISEGDCGRYGRNEAFTDEYDENRQFNPSPAGATINQGSGSGATRTTYSNDPTNGQDRGYAGAPDTSGDARSCRRRKIVQRVQSTRYAFTNWIYRSEPIDVSAYKLRTATDFANDICLQVNGVCATTDSGNPLESVVPGTVQNAGAYDERELATISGSQGIPLIQRTWDGCIEERATVRETTYWPIPSNAQDLDIDTAPSSTAGSRWGPSLYRVVYPRGVNDASSSSEYRTTNISTRRNFGWPDYFCGAPASKLQQWATAAAYEAYIDALTPTGNTHHDIGMIWGARLMSPTGIFASENATTPQGGQIERHMIFMTDGQTCTNGRNYAAYGIAWFDRRQTDVNAAPTWGCSSDTDTGGTLSEQVDARFAALCTDVKARNITLWVVYFGSTDSATTTRMTNCASPGRFFSATNSAALLDSFRLIASQISQLRLTQ